MHHPDDLIFFWHSQCNGNEKIYHVQRLKAIYGDNKNILQLLDFDVNNNS